MTTTASQPGVAYEVLMDEERDLMFPDWQSPYFVALAPGSPETVRERVDYAERAILSRLAELVSRPEREMEQFAIRDALDALYVITKEKLDFPRLTPGPSNPV
jgi:hypothetical protein